MACNKNKSSKSCGCSGSMSYETYDVSNFNDCNLEPCSELFSTECIVNVVGDISYSNGSKSISVPVGERINDVIQKLIVGVLSGVDNFDNIPSGIKCTSDNESITVTWNEMPEKSMSVLYKKESDETWTEKEIEGNKYSILNLKEKTVYNVKLLNKTNAVSSVTLTIKTE